MREWYITNEYGQTINFNVDSPYRLTNIEGISTNVADFSESQTDKSVGSTISSYSIKPKSITLSGDINVKNNYSARRDFLDILIPGSQIKFKLVDKENDIDHYINCYIATSPVIDEEFEVYKPFQLVLRAPYPYWRDNNSSIVSFVEYVSGFRFRRSFSNTTPWQIGTRNVKQLQYLLNRGSDKTGFVARFEATGYVKAPELLKVLAQEHIRFSNLEMQQGDVVIVSTYENERYCKMIRNKVEKNIYNLMDDDSNFFVLDKGSNAIRFGSSGTVDNLLCTISFANTYVGE